MAQVRINKSEILSNDRYVLTRIHFDLQKENGGWENQVRQVFDHGNAAAVLLYNKDKRTVILTKQFRMATYVNGNSSGMLIEACAGMLEKNEPPETTIIREVEEETGYVITSVQKAYEAYSSAGAFTELLYLYVAPYTHEQKVKQGGGLANEGEDVQVMELPFEMAIQMMETGEIKDAKTIMLLQYAQVKGLV